MVWEPLLETYAHALGIEGDAHGLVEQRRVRADDAPGRGRGHGLGAGRGPWRTVQARRRLGAAQRRGTSVASAPCVWRATSRRRRTSTTAPARARRHHDELAASVAAGVAVFDGARPTCSDARVVTVWRRRRACGAPWRTASRSQRGEHLRRACEALVGLLGQRPAQHLPNRGSTSAERSSRRGGCLLEVLSKIVGERGALERRLADQHRVQRHAQRVQVRAAVERLAAQLLGRHVRGRANQAARSRPRSPARRLWQCRSP